MQPGNVELVVSNFAPLPPRVEVEIMTQAVLEAGKVEVYMPIPIVVKWRDDSGHAILQTLSRIAIGTYLERVVWAKEKTHWLYLRR